MLKHRKQKFQWILIAFISPLWCFKGGWSVFSCSLFFLVLLIFFFSPPPPSLMTFFLLMSPLQNILFFSLCNVPLSQKPSCCDVDCTFNLRTMVRAVSVMHREQTSEQPWLPCCYYSVTTRKDLLPPPPFILPF